MARGRHRWSWVVEKEMLGISFPLRCFVHLSSILKGNVSFVKFSFTFLILSRINLTFSVVYRTTSGPKGIQQDEEIRRIQRENKARVLPVYNEYSIDVVECNGEMLVVLLSEFLETATLRVWKYDEANRGWHQIATMPATNSHEWYGKKADINCVGAGNQIFICLNSTELCTYVMCDLETNKWVEFPNCCINGQVIDFMSAFSFEPRIKASV
ncbi:F-box only protein 13 [Glycine soja]|uniref:F-box only protein 13 n=1 Tax=Glycine soja TaxID=3848 RepID=A0A445GFX6_GLYSO|nr:F-box only protein 13 [Glycine soja]